MDYRERSELSIWKVQYVERVSRKVPVKLFQSLFNFFARNLHFFVRYTSARETVFFCLTYRGLLNVISRYFKKKFERKIFNSVVGFFSLSWNCPCAVFTGLESCWCLVFYIVGVTAVRKPEVAGWNPAIYHIFLRLFRYSLTRSHFPTTKKGVFPTKI